MSVQTQSGTSTRLFARVLGPYLVISMAIHVLRKDDVSAIVAGLESNAVVPWVAGAFALLAGLVVIGLHQEWQSVPGIIVAALGTLIALEGIGLMAVPDLYIDKVESIPFVAGAVVMGLVGLYLTYVGWKPERD
jgi:hypothetical protein